MTYEGEKLEQQTPGVCPCCGKTTDRGMLDNLMPHCVCCGWNEAASLAQHNEWCRGMVREFRDLDARDKEEGRR